MKEESGSVDARKRRRKRSSTFAKCMIIFPAFQYLTKIVLDHFYITDVKNDR